MNVDVVKTIPFTFIVKKREDDTGYVKINTVRMINMTNVNFSPDLIELCNFDVSILFNTDQIGDPDENLFNLYELKIVFPFFDNLVIDRSFYYNSAGVSTNISKAHNLSYDLKFTGRSLRPSEEIYIKSDSVYGSDIDGYDNEETINLTVSSLHIVISGMFKFIKYK